MRCLMLGTVGSVIMDKRDIILFGIFLGILFVLIYLALGVGYDEGYARCRVDSVNPYDFELRGMIE